MTASPAVELSVCPAWCADYPSGHQQALDEGCHPSTVMHRSVEFQFRLDTMSNPYGPHQKLRECPATVHLELSQEADVLPYGGYPLIELEITKMSLDTGRHERTAVDITSSEARSMARMLERLADLFELHHEAQP